MPVQTRTVPTAVRAITVTEPTLATLWQVVGRPDILFDPHEVMTGRAPLPASLLAAVSDLQPEEFGKLTPSEARAVTAAVREVLADFLPLLQELHGAKGLLDQLARPCGTRSSGPSASS
ncbi:hypothetical protein [Megalodesulfovibrio gigas]|uniref:Uncharacterized protein n=1 Tax=Megalodesulfovibrio gigas (strain ATCC 19364 / DSM 1382 / NCIMB 9332 / VKM B-1759) TaxID=1121448 RepID=T2GE09_MEGG1|nr:hypothetical protein [Megalodesulfovibrio gigas]AGW14122.1 hypothetical protein DGI_2370 [Megalodesulfovibrio gigas DSM 1382 = ATCC 19364]